MKRILIVEDDVALLEALTDRLENEGYVLRVSTDGNAALAEALGGEFDLIVLDLRLPGRSGLEICTELRRRSIATPILILTARGDVTDRVVGLRLGADDYLGKPFNMLELMARIDALIRRSSTAKIAPSLPYRVGALEIDLRRGQVFREGKLIALSAREWDLLSYMVQHAGAVLSRDELLKEVWGFAPDLMTRTVDVHISLLRQKLEPDPGAPQLIITVPRRGYKFAQAGMIDPLGPM